MATPQELADALLSRMDVYQNNQTLNPMGIPTNIESFGVNGSVGDKFGYTFNNSRMDDPNVIKTGIDEAGVRFTDDSGKTYKVSGGFNRFDDGGVKTNVKRINFAIPITKEVEINVGGSRVNNPFYKRTGVDTVGASYTNDNGSNYSLDANLQPGNLGGMLYFRKPIE